MDEDTPGDVSLSMIDVVTNGLASLLVLLFLLLLLKGQVYWATSSSHASQLSAAVDDPLVILVTTDGPDPLFPGSVSPWQIDADGPKVAKEHGPAYAAAYFRRQPATGEEIKLKFPTKFDTCFVDVYVAGKYKRISVNGKNELGEPVTVWPLAESSQ